MTRVMPSFTIFARNSHLRYNRPIVFLVFLQVTGSKIETRPTDLGMVVQTDGLNND
jgi:hypothetical protein